MRGPYRERVTWPGWFYFIVAVGVSVAVFGLLGSLVRDGPSWPLLLIGIPLAAVPVVFWRLRYLQLEFGPEGAAFGFGGIGRRVPQGRLISAEVEEYRPARYMGWGYRMGWEGRDRAYSVLGCRRGIRLLFEDEQGHRWKVFLSSRDPDAAVAALKDA